MRKKPNEPTPNADGTYLPMPWRGERRLEKKERSRYREAQQRHHARFPEYASGWRRPSELTTSRVWDLVGESSKGIAGPLSAVEMQALVVALDAAIQAGQDGRLL